MISRVSHSDLKALEHEFGSSTRVQVYQREWHRVREGQLGIADERARSLSNDFPTPASRFNG